MIVISVLYLGRINFKAFDKMLIISRYLEPIFPWRKKKNDVAREEFSVGILLIAI